MTTLSNIRSTSNAAISSKPTTATRWSSNAGRGCFLYDLDGKKYLDLVSGIGVNALGYAHPRIVKTMREQAARLVHISNLYYHEYQAPLAEKLCSLSGMQRVFFSNSEPRRLKVP